MKFIAQHCTQSKKRKKTTLNSVAVGVSKIFDSSEIFWPNCPKLRRRDTEHVQPPDLVQRAHNVERGDDKIRQSHAAAFLPAVGSGKLLQHPVEVAIPDVDFRPFPPRLRAL